jgi:hypothetical protein
MSTLERRYYDGDTWAERFQADLMDERYPHVDAETFSEWLATDGRKHLERCIVAYVDWLEYREQNPS